MLQQFDCKNCGAGLEFDPKSQGLKCEYCGYLNIIKVEHKPAEEHDLFSAPKNTGWDAQVKTVKCDNCGATISSDILAGKCAFCDSSYVKEIQPNPDIIRPENMIPFRVDRENARQRFRHWLGKGWFRPSKLKNLGRLNILKGVYVPFWTYDCNAYSTWSAMSGYYYYVSQSYRDSQGRTRTRQVRKTRWSPSSGSRSGFYNDVLVPASQGLHEELVQKTYPFRLGELVPYKAEFLSGWLAEEYAVNIIEGWLVAKRNVESQEHSRCGSDVPGDTYRALSVNTQLSNQTYKHILLPLFIAAYNFKSKTYHVLINGQTGEVQGEAPISWLKVGAVIAAIAGIVAAAVYFWS